MSAIAHLMIGVICGFLVAPVFRAFLLAAWSGAAFAIGRIRKDRS